MKPFFIHETSRVLDTFGDSDAKIYQNCDVRQSHIGANSTVGDFSRLGNCRLSDHVAIQRNAMMYHVQMGRYSYTGKNFTAWHCSIGSFCSISWNVSIGGANHDYSRITTHSFLYSKDFGMLPNEEYQGYDRFAKPCVIENDVWIGANACICRGVTVHAGAVIAAGAVVTHDVPPYTIVTGVPARPLKKRFDEETIELLLKSQWWDFPEAIIKEHFHLFNAHATANSARKILALRTSIERGEI